MQNTLKHHKTFINIYALNESDNISNKLCKLNFPIPMKLCVFTIARTFYCISSGNNRQYTHIDLKRLPSKQLQDVTMKYIDYNIIDVYV